MACIEALATGIVPNVKYPIDAELERAKEHERVNQFKKVGSINS